MDWVEWMNENGRITECQLRGGKKIIKIKKSKETSSNWCRSRQHRAEERGLREAVLPSTNSEEEEEEAQPPIAVN